MLAGLQQDKYGRALSFFALIGVPAAVVAYFLFGYWGCVDRCVRPPVSQSGRTLNTTIAASQMARPSRPAAPARR
jgi:hypothetical protein